MEVRVLNICIVGMIILDDHSANIQPIRREIEHVLTMLGPIKIKIGHVVSMNGPIKILIEYVLNINFPIKIWIEYNRCIKTGETDQFDYILT